MTKKWKAVGAVAVAVLLSGASIAPAAAVTTAAAATRSCSSLAGDGGSIVGRCTNSDPRVPLRFKVSCWGYAQPFYKSVDVGYGGSFRVNVCRPLDGVTV